MTWWSFVIVGGVLVAVVAFVLLSGGRGAPPGGQRAGEQGLPVGAAAPAVALASSDGRTVSLDQMRGSRLVVYFYEGGS